MTKTTKAMIVGALVLFAGAATWLLYNQADDGATNQQPPPLETSEPAQSPEPDPEPDTQSYSNAALGVSFEYPSDWQTLVCDEDESMTADTQPTVYLASDDRGLGISDDGSSILCGSGTDFSPQAAIFSRESIDPPTGEVETIIVGDVEAEKYVYVEGGDGALRPEGFTTITYVIPRSDGSKLMAVYSQWPDGTEGYDTSDASRGVFESIIENSLELE